MKIKTKIDAKMFLKSYTEFSHNDWVEGELWFRYYDKGDDKLYTINHETEGIIGVTEEEAISYVYRNRKRLNSIEHIETNNIRYRRK